MANKLKKEYWNKSELSLWERAYIFEICRGLFVTTSMFFGNMFKWMTFRKGALTSYYPEELRPDYSKINRGMHILVQRENGKPQCIACGLCAAVCPAKAIDIEAAFDLSDQKHPKYCKSFEIDYSTCIFCGLCIEACPEDAIRMDASVKNLPAFNRKEMFPKRELLLNWKPQVDSKKGEKK